MPILKRDAVSVKYEVRGEGAPVILVNGLALIGKLWDFVADGLAERGHQVVTLDNRGVGDTVIPEDAQWTIADMSEDVLAIADTLGWDTFNLGGLSMGGMITQHLMITSRARLRSAVLMATAPGMVLPGSEDGPKVDPPSPQAMQILSRPPDPEDMEGMQRNMVEALCGPNFAEKNPEKLKWFIGVQKDYPMEMKGVMGQMQALMAFKPWNELPNTNTPTVVIHGDTDQLLTYSNGRALSEQIPGAQLVTAPDSGHLLFMEQPELLIDTISAHIAANAP